tara:strand:+ start:4216 stop:4392 length:177 start_codon:yes stop_codon:yes gene_type:complete
MKYLKCDNCGKIHQDTPDFTMCDCGRVAMRMEWATQEEINTAQDDAYLLNQEHIENRP